MSRSLKYIMLGLLVGLCVLPAPAAFSQTIEGESGDWHWTRKFEQNATNIDELDLLAFEGNVIVSGTPSDVITFSYRQRLRGESGEEVRELTEDTTLNFTRSGARLSVRPSARLIEAFFVEITISVPSTIGLSLNTAAGNVRLEDVSASAFIETGAGNVRVSRVGGEVRVRSGSGNVFLEDVDGMIDVNTAAGAVSATDIGSGIEVTSGGGGIELSNIAGDVSAVTAGGSISVDHVNGDAVLFTSGGDIEVGFMEGTVSASTSGGEIELRQVAGFAEMISNGGHIQGAGLNGGVHAETLAGNITLDDVTGPLQVLAEVGDIDIWIRDEAFPNNAEANVEAHYGDINLSLPQALNAVLSVAIFDNGQIHLDDSVGTIEVLRERPSSRENQLRRAEYQLGNGQGNVSLTTRSGDIKVRLN